MKEVSQMLLGDVEMYLKYYCLYCKITTPYFSAVVLPSSPSKQQFVFKQARKQLETIQYVAEENELTSVIGSGRWAVGAV